MRNVLIFSGNKNNISNRFSRRNENTATLILRDISINKSGHYYVVLQFQLIFFVQMSISCYC